MSAPDRVRFGDEWIMKKLNIIRIIPKHRTWLERAFGFIPNKFNDERLDEAICNLIDTKAKEQIAILYDCDIETTSMDYQEVKTK